MKGLIVVGTLAVLMVALTGCVMPVGSPVVAGIYSDVTASHPSGVGDLSVGYGKVGQSEATGIVCVATGDASISAAARSAQITKIHSVDVNYYNIWILYSKVTTTVYGE